MGTFRCVLNGNNIVNIRIEIDLLFILLVCISVACISVTCISVAVRSGFSNDRELRGAIFEGHTVGVCRPDAHKATDEGF